MGDITLSTICNCYKNITDTIIINVYRNICFSKFFVVVYIKGIIYEIVITLIQFQQSGAFLDKVVPLITNKFIFYQLICCFIPYSYINPKVIYTIYNNIIKFKSLSWIVHLLRTAIFFLK